MDANSSLRRSGFILMVIVLDITMMQIDDIAGARQLRRSQSSTGMNEHQPAFTRLELWVAVGAEPYRAGLP